MMAKAPKRKIFDAVDMMIEGMVSIETSSGFQSLLMDKIKLFYDHLFRLHEGERSNDIVEASRNKGC